MGSVLVLIVIGALLLLQLRIRPLRVKQLWIGPCLTGAICLLIITNNRPRSATELLITAGGLLVGALFGIYRARIARVWGWRPAAVIAVQHPPVSVALWGVFIVLRALMRLAGAHSALDYSGTPALAALTAGAIATQAVWLALRYRRGQFSPWTPGLIKNQRRLGGRAAGVQ